MKFTIPPFGVSDFVPFTPALSSSFVSRSSKSSFAGLTKNGLWMWLVCDTTINLYHTENSEWFGGYHFEDSLKNPSAKITAVVEFCSSHISFPCLLIAVNHDDETLICMYDINLSKVVRSVLVPDTVLKIEVISSNGGACMDTHYLSIQLRYLFGVIALGTAKGLVYFLDLCLDENFVCDENLPNITFVLNKHELLPEWRERVISKQQHIFMLLNDHGAHNGTFEFESRSLPLSEFSYGKIHITALKYIQSTTTLAIGFNFGGIQLWDLSDFCLLYTVANQTHEIPIIAFAFQEPENDPRNFCYLWIIRGFNADEKPKDISVAAMYSLTYRERTYVESYGNLYKDLQSCCQRFEYPLTSEPMTSTMLQTSAGSCLLSCQTVCQTYESHFEMSLVNESDTATENMSLCFLSWLTWDDSGSSYHMILFDLNQWYQAQMPFSISKSDPSHLNPYFASFSLEEVVQNFDLEPLLGLYIIPHSIKKFKFTSPAEEFFYPSSLDFQAFVFCNNGISKATFLGIQRSLLYEIGDMGPNALSNPKEFYNDLIHCGLISDSYGNSDRVPLIIQREAMLQLFLEYHLPFFFMKCMKDWRYSDSIQEGCTSRALLNWSWKRVFTIKTSFDKLNLPLFNCSGSDIETASLKSLYSYKRQLDLIDSIIEGYQKFATPRTEQGIQELKCRKDVVFSINMYLQVILWLRSVHILPEICEGEETDKNIFYPVSALVSSYARRRNNLQKIHNSIVPTDILLIDGLMKEVFNENTWLEKGGNGLYPPPSIYAALSCYLLDGIDLNMKHSLIYYLLLDICSVSHNVKHPLLSEVKKFPLVFDMPQSISKLVKAFWCLDQFKFEDALKRLFHPVVKPSDILPWQHRRIIKSFLFQKEPQKALKYINHMDPPEKLIEDAKLHLSVLLSKGSIIQALHYQRTKQSEGFGTELLNHLLLGCHETHRLKDLMYLPLNPLESLALIKFLSENDDPSAQEALVMYHLLRCNFFEAAKVNEKLSVTQLSNSLPTYDRKSARDALVDGFLSSVPKTEKNLVEEINRFQTLPVRKNESIHPLSLSVRSASVKQISYSDILTSLISDASAMNSIYLESQTPLKSVSQSYFNNIPFLRQPLTPDFTRLSTETVLTTPVVKRLLISPTSEFSSPSKKSRLLDNVTFKTNSLSKRKIPKHLVNEVASLLQSPPIHRRNSTNLKDDNIYDSPSAPPQGILKKKTESYKVPLSDMYTSKTPPVLSDVENSNEDCDGESMSIDNEIFHDIHERQIRFTVPSEEELNASVISIPQSESSVLGVRNESVVSSNSNKPSQFLKNVPLLDPFASGDQKFINVAHRTLSSSLTRKPVKYSAPTSENVNELAVFVENVESSSLISSQSLTQFKKSVKSEIVDEFSDSNSSHGVEILDIISARDVEPVQMESVSAPAVSSSSTMSPLAISSNLESESGWRPVLHLSSTELDYNRSGSSSGNSSYNSVSERSLSVTPRRPLRHSNGSASTTDLSGISAVEDKKVAEIENYDDADIAIVDEVPALPFEEIESVEDKCADLENTSQSISFANRTTVHSVKDLIDEQIEKSLGKCYESEHSNISSNTNIYRCVQEMTDESMKNALESERGNIFLKNELLDKIVQSSNQGTCVSPGNKNNSITSMKCLEVMDTELQNTVPESDKELIFVQTESMSQTVHNINQDLNKANTTSNVVASNEFCSEFSSSVHEGNSTDITVYDFTEDIPAPSLPAYVPIKERISKSSEPNNGKDVTSSSLHQKKPESIETSKSEEMKCTTMTLLQSHKGEPKFWDAKKMCTPRREASLKERAALASFTPTTVSISAVSQKLSERFDFMANNSDFYENNRLYRETMHLLKESDLSQNSDLTSVKSSRKTRTFVFEKPTLESTSKTGEDSSKSEVSTAKNSEEAAAKMKEFLESWHPESYEQFSHSIQEGTSDNCLTENLKSSPNKNMEASSASRFDSMIEHSSKNKGRNRKQRSTKKDNSVIKKTKSSAKKSKDKVAKKMEFSFAEPHSPTDPEVFEALNTTPDYQIKPFMFSPPLTRGRFRQKKLNESLGSSFSSVVSETSFAMSKKPPVDPILEGIMTEHTGEPKKLTDATIKSSAKSSTRKKCSIKKTKDDLPHFKNIDVSLNISNLQTEDIHIASESKVLSSAKYRGKHKMVLRQAKVKPRTEQLF